MTTDFFPQRLYIFLFTLLGLVYVAGLFVPLMDNDSAHHANIALHMYLTGDYVRLVDYGKDYLDKPHLHFWLCALSYEVFGVNNFAYKLPSFLFTLLAIYSTYRLGKSLYDANVGKLAALITASAFAFILANNDVRMDAILTATIVFASWQFVAFIQTRKLVFAGGTALGMALGFATKGHIGVAVPAAGAFFYILYKKDWALFTYWKLYVIPVLFAVLIAPVVYCYYLQFNLHPEKVVRGKDHIDGVKFILFGQSVERFQGDSFGGDGKNDHFFFLHSFLWAFAPWSVIAYVAAFDRLKKIRARQMEWMTIAMFILMLLVVSFSGFKLPHYLNIIFPSTAVFTAAYILQQQHEPRWARFFYILQLCIAVLLLLSIATLTLWAFPVKKLWVIPGVILVLTVFFYSLQSSLLNKTQKAISLSVVAVTFCFLLLNTNFYPQLLKYQAGNELAVATRGKIDPQQVYFWKETRSSSFCFYTQTLRRTFEDSLLEAHQPVWLIYDIRDEESIQQAGYTIGKKFSAIDYEITRLQLKFIDPATRESQCTQLVVGELMKQ